MVACRVEDEYLSAKGLGPYVVLTHMSNTLIYVVSCVCL